MVTTRNSKSINPTKGENIYDSSVKSNIIVNIGSKIGEEVNHIIDEENFQVNDLSISEYEKARLENIRRNEQFLRQLGVASLKNSFLEEKPPKSNKLIKGTKSTHKTGLKIPILPSRRSERVTLDKLASEIKVLKSNGNELEANIRQSEFDSMLAKKIDGSYVVENNISEQEVYSRILDSVSLENFINVSDESEKTLLKKEFLNIWEPLSKEKKNNIKSSKMTFNTESFENLSLSEEDVAKLTPGRITAVALHPSDTSILAFAGDKNGFIGIWDVNSSKDSIHDGVYKFRPHVSNIIKFHIDENRLTELTSISYDGTVKVLDLEKECFRLGFEAIEKLEDLYFTDACYSSFLSESLLIGKSSGEASLVDFRASSTVYQWNYEIQENKLNSIQFHPTNSNLIISAASRSGVIMTHDIRKAGKSWKPISTLSLHSKTTNAAYVSPDGNYLVSVSLDDTIRTWKNFDGSNKEVICNTLRHNNFTGRWLSTFRPTFDPKRPHTFVMGSMLQPRRIEIFSIKEEKSSTINLNLSSNLMSDNLASVNSRNCFHPRLEMILGSNSSGKVHLFR